MKEDLMNQLEEKFKDIKKELKFKSNLDDLDKIFFIRDFIQKEGFVSSHLSRAICARIVDLYNNWVGYLHGLLMPVSNSLIAFSESQIFEDNEREEISMLINKMMTLTSRNILVGIKKDKIMESKFIDDSVRLWNEIKPSLIKLMEKVNKSWIEKTKNVKDT